MKKFNLYNKKISGMTLIELMIVIAIIAILSLISYSFYESQSRKKNRVMAISSLLQARAQLEKCFLNNQPNDYSGCVLDVSKSIDTKKLFTITPVFAVDSNNKPVSYTLTANELNVNADSECSSFSINNVGIKTSTGTGSLQRCWSQ